MSTPDGSPLESEGVFHSMCDTPCGPDCDTPRKPVVTPQPDGSVHIDSIGPGESVEIALPFRTSAPMFRSADPSLESEVEQWHYSDRRMPFPWGFTIFMAVLMGLSAFGIAWVLQELGWAWW